MLRFNLLNCLQFIPFSSFQKEQLGILIDHEFPSALK